MNSNALQSLVREAVEKYGNNIDKGVVYIREELDRNKKLRDSCINELINSAIREQFHWYRHGVRKVLKGTERGADVIGAVSKIAAQSILENWPFLDKTLGDATKSELLIESEAEYCLAAGHRANANFYKALSYRLPRDSTRVCEKVSNELAVQLWRSALTKSTRNNQVWPFH